MILVVILDRGPSGNSRPIKSLDQDNFMLSGSSRATVSSLLGSAIKLMRSNFDSFMREERQQLSALTKCSDSGHYA